MCWSMDDGLPWRAPPQAASTTPPPVNVVSDDCDQPPPPYQRADAICSKAASLVGGDRAKTHGDKIENHQNIAALWNAYLGWALEEPLTAQNVAMMMALVKVARTKLGSHNLDDYVDLAGYAGVAGEIAEFNASLPKPADKIGGTI